MQRCSIRKCRIIHELSKKSFLLIWDSECWRELSTEVFNLIAWFDIFRSSFAEFNEKTKERNIRILFNLRSLLLLRESGSSSSGISLESFWCFFASFFILTFFITQSYDSHKFIQFQKYRSRKQIYFLSVVVASLFSFDF